MNTRERIKFQKNLISELMDWKFADMVYTADYNELSIENEMFRFPFYAETTRGKYFTFQPSIRIHSETLIHDINQIIGNKILTNGILLFSDRMNNYANQPDINEGYNESEVKNFRGQYYYIKVQDHNQMERVSEWFKMYISAIAFPILEEMEDSTKMYTFLKNIFLNQVAFEKGKEYIDIVFANQMKLNDYAITTMVYLGYILGEKDVSEVAHKVIEYKEGPLYSERIRDLINHFES